MDTELRQNDEASQQAAAHIPWHTAFVQAIRFELKDYQDVLEFHTEYQLTTEPLRIDCVVVKKAKDAVIKKNIAAIFREWNILEYKSPDDYVSVSDFYKAYGYACLYASLNNTPVTGMTLTFVESRYSEKLIGHLRKERKYTVEESSPGIYTVKGDILPIQIIDSRRLSEEENLWLKGLDNRLELSAFKKIDAAVGRLGKEGLVQLQAYLYALVQANPKTMEEAITMSDSALTLEKVLEDAGWLARWEARGEAKGKAEGKAEGQLELLALLKSGKTIEQVEQILGLSVS